MNFENLLFTGMDIPNEARSILSNTEETITNGMTTNERKAYKYGVETTLSLIRHLLEEDENIVVHVSGCKMPEEFDINDLLDIIDDKGSVIV